MPHIIITWQAIMDDRTCPICNGLNGYQWIIDANQPFPQVLTHPQFGVVWSPEGSTTHKHRQKCRCSLGVNIEISDLVAKVADLLNLVAMSQFKYLETLT